MYINRFARELSCGWQMSEMPFVVISATPTCQCTTRRVDSPQTPCKCLKTGIIITGQYRRFDYWLFVATSTHLRRVLVVISLFFRCFLVRFSIGSLSANEWRAKDERKTNEDRAKTEREAIENGTKMDRKRLKFSVFCKQVCLHTTFILLKMLA